ncbi:MAG: hypothetical protein QXZ06_07045 [Candidatus Jordarchaeales archaeon]
MKLRSMVALALIFSLFMSALVISFTPKTSWIIIPYRDVETRHFTFTVELGRYYDVNFYLHSGYTVNFSFNYSGLTVMNVYLMDSENFKKYQEGENYTSILIISASSTSETYQGNYTAVKSDRYYLVFENYFLNADVSLTISLEVLKFLPVPYRT